MRRRKNTYSHQTKVGRHYIETFLCLDQFAVQEALMKDLIAKKLHGCSYIRAIFDRNNYDGTRDITVYYDNNTRRVYTVNA